MADDLQLARNIYADAYEASTTLTGEHRREFAEYARQGAYDDHLEVKCAFAALAIGRSLVREDLVKALGVRALHDLVSA